MIPLVEANSTLEMRDRWKVIQKMEMVTQYTFAGDYTGKQSASSVLCRLLGFPR